MRGTQLTQATQPLASPQPLSPHMRREAPNTSHSAGMHLSVTAAVYAALAAGLGCRRERRAPATSRTAGHQRAHPAQQIHRACRVSSQPPSQRSTLGLAIVRRPTTPWRCTCLRAQGARPPAAAGQGAPHPESRCATTPVVAVATHANVDCSTCARFADWLATPERRRSSC